MKRPIRSLALAALAAGLVGTAAPIPAAQAEPAFGGYSSEAVATPLKIEIYEPVVPIPAEPQLEFELAYTKVEATSGDGAGLASWLWPGDPLGQGCKTFVEQLGLGDTGLCKDGYPVQVNSRTPGENDKASDEPVPGSLMRTSASEKGVQATVGWSSNSDVSDPEKKDQPGVPGLPEPPGGDQPGLPGLPELPADPLKALQDLGAAITGKDRAVAAAEEDGDGGGTPGLPPELAMLVDVDGLVSDARTMLKGGTVTTVATSKLGQLSLLGGMITADGITVRTTTTADGKKPTASGITRIGGLEIAGTPMSIGPDGVEFAGQKQKIPGLSDDPGKALEQLGVQLLLPKPKKMAKGDEAAAAFSGLRIIIDTKPLRALLKDVPLQDLVDMIPFPEEAKQLKSLLGAATQLAPKLVITAGNAAAETSTVPKMEFDLPTVDPSDLTGAGAPPVSGGTSGSATAGGAAAGVPGVAGEAAAAGDAGGLDALAADPMASSGLPPLASIPGALMVGGLILAAGVGWWLQKIGGLVLGGAGSCSHGLETGVPDLRGA